MGRKRTIKKELDISNLPHRGKIIDWANSIGYKIHFIYDDIEGDVEIIDYGILDDTNLIKVKIKYENYTVLLGIDNFKRGQFGELLNKRTKDFKIEIGTKFKDNNRDLIITDREHRKNKKGQISKWYKYKCYKCGYEGWIIEGGLITQNTGCSCCCHNPRIVVEHINSIVTTDTWMIPYFQGGYDEAKLYTKRSNQKIYPICPDCGRVREKKMKINDIYTNHSIGCSCVDSIPYPEKLVYSVLEHLGIDFQTQLTKSTFKWCEKYKYDFYFKFNNEEILIETNGEQHYKDKSRKHGRTFEEEVENDRLKKELALKNGVLEENYIRIDCRKSELEFIKQNILNSKLNELFNLNKIDWSKAEGFALSNLVKVACDYKKNNPEFTCNDIAKLMKNSHQTVRRYLKKGTKIGWCNYNAEEEIMKSKTKTRRLRKNNMFNKS